VVLSGGAARGAYEAGVLAGIAEVTGASAGGPALFDVIAGTSVGALNGAWLAANAHRADHDVAQLASLWTSIELDRHLRLDWKSFAGVKRGRKESYGPSILDPGPLERLVTDAIAWDRLHQNLEQGRTQALVLAALHVGSGVTTLFYELAPGATFRAVTHPRRLSRQTRLEPRHVLASAALPGLFPARRIGGGFFADGSLRFNTPISSALRAGAEKLVVITMRHPHQPHPDIDGPGAAHERYPRPIFLAGKLLNALMLDPVADDLQVLLRFNQVLAAARAALGPRELSAFEAALAGIRGAPYRAVETLVFEPSQNIGELAGAHLRDRKKEDPLPPLYRALLAPAASARASWESDLASYVLLDGAWARVLTDLGRADALARRDEVRAFFSGGRAPG
jgi:NTE family protein